MVRADVQLKQESGVKVNAFNLNITISFNINVYPNSKLKSIDLMNIQVGWICDATCCAILLKTVYTRIPVRMIFQKDMNDGWLFEVSLTTKAVLISVCGL